MRLLPAAIIAVAIVLAPLVWFAARAVFSSGGPQGLGGNIVDDAARLELIELRSEIAILRQRLDRLEQGGTVPIAPNNTTNQDDSSFEEGQISGAIRAPKNTLRDRYAEVVLIENRRKLNQGLTLPSRDFLFRVLGAPTSDPSDTCGPMTNGDLREKLVIADVGNIKVHLLEPAVESLRRVFDQIRAIDVDLYQRIASSGSLCVRRVRGSSSAMSSHAFGLAIDLNIDGKLDTLGDGRTQLGLTILADIFQKEGWFWGASFAREDSMHFEVSRELIEQWISQGKL